GGLLLIAGLPLEGEHIQQQAAIDQEEQQGAKGSEQRDAEVVAHGCIHRSGQKPELYDKINSDQGQQRGKKRGSLSLPLHYQTSPPTAKISSPRCTSLIRGRGRVGGPAKGRPSSTVK